MLKPVLKQPVLSQREKVDSIGEDGSSDNYTN